ncbi:hypothetical protein GCM10009555_069270 [Acrocarpospora macrocephala]|uniref:Uncharacterized protein n=1 Tax=Acrocarpospora macrocephala TaxID=150177 RepID=A0A5M3X625_9ACTN|nr:hypothetical protein [Acrocarpospora macrocephala]GES16106.1 hypothetical protein Amac_097040 [Acrocarpospora macrocephala]
MLTGIRQGDRSALDLITHSPDGESRGRLFRAGDFFPMSPSNHILSAPYTLASPARPWGLRHLVVPPITAGAHEGGSNETSESSSDGTSPNEETSKD